MERTQTNSTNAVVGAPRRLPQDAVRGERKEAAVHRQVATQLESLDEVLRLTDQEAQAIMVRACLRRPPRCPRCEEPLCYRLGLERLRCSRCLLTFRLFTGRLLARLRIPAKSWLAVLKCFELGIARSQAAMFSRLAPPTLYRALETIRLSLALRDPQWRAELAGRDRAPELFGVRELEGDVRVECIPGGADLLQGKDGPRSVLHRNGFVYTSACAGYRALLCHGKTFDAAGSLAGETRRLNGDPFLRFLVNRTTKHYGIPLKSFPLYMKEQEFRFNHRGRSLFAYLLDSIARYVPSKPAARAGEDGGAGRALPGRMA